MKQPKWKTKGKRSGRGRPPMEGDRYDCGKLKPPGPNARTVEIRAALLGIGGYAWTMAGPNTVAYTDADGVEHRIDLSKGENAFDVMLERRWISEDDHRCGRRYAGLFGRAGVNIPSLAVSRQEEGGERSGVEKHKGFMDMSDEEKTAVFDAAFSVDRLPGFDQQLGADANATLRAIWRQATSEQAGVLFEVCVLQWWPAWCVGRLTGREAGEDAERKRVALLTGLRAARQVFNDEDWRRTKWKPAEPVKTTYVRPATSPRGPRREEHISYVDASGAPLFEAVVRRSRLNG